MKWVFKAPIMIGAILSLALTAIADWPVEIQGPPGHALTYPIIESDGSEGAFIGGSALMATGFDVWLFRVTANGELAWSASDSVFYLLPDDQLPLEIKSDGHDGCLVLIEDWPGYPPVRNRLILLRYNDIGDLMWATMVGDSQPGFRQYPSLTVVGNQAVVFWLDGPSSSQNILYQRICLTDGTPLDERGRYLADAFFHDVTVIGDSLLVAAGDSLYLVSLVNGLVISARSGAPLSLVQVLSLDNIVLVAGWQAGALLLEYFSNMNLWRTDTMATGLSLPVELEILPYRNGAFISYQGNYDLFFRIWLPGSELSEEMIICNDPDYQWAHKSAVTDSAVVVAWYESRDGNRDVYIQQIRNDQVRWINGLRVGSVNSASPKPPIDVCTGGDYGLMVWGYNGYFYVQPVDSLTNVAVPVPHPSPPSEFKLRTPFPNPCNGTVRMEFELAKSTNVTLTVFNVLGRKVVTLVDDEWRFVGIHQVSWNLPTGVASGKYFVWLGNGSNFTTTSLVIIR